MTTFADLIDFVRPLIWTLLIIAAVCVAAGALLLALTYRRLRRLHLPRDADLLTTLRAVPFGLVLALDLLDFGLDFLATPVVWTVLNRFNLQALRNVAALQALVPFTQPVPLLTVAWIAARVFKRRFP